MALSTSMHRNRSHGRPGEGRLDGSAPMQQGCVAAVRADELDADRQAARSGGTVTQGTPSSVQMRLKVGSPVAPRPARRFAERRRREQQVAGVEDLARRIARRAPISGSAYCSRVDRSVWPVE